MQIISIQYFVAISHDNGFIFNTYIYMYVYINSQANGFIFNTYIYMYVYINSKANSSRSAPDLEFVGASDSKKVLR